MHTARSRIIEHRLQLGAQLLLQVRTSSFAEGLSEPELSSRIPELIESLGGGSDGSAAQLTGEQHRLLDEHLGNRLRQGATLNEMLSELAGLGQLITQLLGVERGRTAAVSARQAAGVLAEINMACVFAMKVFNEQMLEDEQPIKRDLRLLERMTSRDGTSFPIDLALLLIAKALSADAVALQLTDGSGRRELVTATSSGDAADWLAEWVGAHEPSAAPLPMRLQKSSTPPARSNHAVFELRIPGAMSTTGDLFVALGDRDTLNASEMRSMATLACSLMQRIECEQARLSLAGRDSSEAVATSQRDARTALLLDVLRGPLADARAKASALNVPGADRSRDAVAEIVEQLDRAAEILARAVGSPV